VKGAQVETGKIKNHRSLRFESVEDALAEIDRIQSADGRGALKTVGNWTPGQILSHVAAWIEYGYDGYPLKPPPFFIRWILKWQVKKYLRDGMPKGVRIPGVPEGTYGADDIPTPAAAARLRQAFLRLKNGEPARFDSPAFGRMSHDDRIRLNLRHAELHLGFLSY
jgi:hypothetical protein